MSDVIIRPIDLDKDADGLAAMWNASDLQWPWSWTEGVPITPDMVREWETEGRVTVTYVAEVDGEIAGYCSFMGEHRGHRDEGYLALLNVHPKYQKRSVGRRLIQKTIERSLQEGWQRQTLGTWSANFKAVPAYKKTGHFWTPDTSAWMQNFIPGALQLSLAKPFFERHDWYSSYVREIEQQEDDQRWEGLKVFVQHWEADGESLTIWIDREARAPVAVETGALQVAAIVEEIEPLAGSKVNLCWRLINKTQDPLSVHIHALGDKGLDIDHRDAFVVPGGETVERVAQIKVAGDAPRSKDDGTAPAVRSIIRLNDDEVKLYSGLRVRKPLSLDTAPGQITVCPGVEHILRLQLHSEMEHPARVTFYLTPPEGLSVDWMTKEIELPAKGHISVPLYVTCSAEAVYTLPVRVAAQGDELKPLNEKVTIFSLGVGGLLVQRQAKSVRLETDALRVTIERSGGAIKVEHRDTRFTIATLNPRLGPPYHPSEFEKKDFELAIEERAGRAIVHLTGEAKHYEGLYLHQEFALSPTGLGTLRYYLENRGSTLYARHAVLEVRGPNDEGRMALALSSGIVHSSLLDYPRAWEDMPRDPAAYAEPWIAWERRGAVAGIAWDRSTTRGGDHWRSSWISKELSVAPGERSEEIGFALYAGSGGWHDVREAALRWIGSWQPGEAQPIVRPPALARLEPGVLATTSDRVSGRLVVDSVSNRATSGQVSLITEAGLSADMDTLPLTDLKRGQACEHLVQFSLPKDVPGVFRGEVRLSLPLSETTRPFQVLRLGTDAPVRVVEDARSGQPVWTIDNGTSQFVVAPNFGPSLIAWMRDGENQLWSSFPTVQGFAWLYPWFGGTHPVLFPTDSWYWEGHLHRERILAQLIETEDASGIIWRGVRLSVRPQKKELVDFGVELDYTTVGQANILKYVYRLSNLRDTEQVVKTRNDVACSLGTEPTKLVLRGEGIKHGPTPWAASSQGQNWGALTNDHTGKTMLLVSRQSDVALNDTGQYGRLLGTFNEVRLAGGETRELVYYLVLADSLEGARDYLVLQDYQG